MRLTASLDGSGNPPITQVKRGGSFLHRLPRGSRHYSHAPWADREGDLYWRFTRLSAALNWSSSQYAQTTRYPARYPVP